MVPMCSTASRTRRRGIAGGEYADVHYSSGVFATSREQEKVRPVSETRRVRQSSATAPRRDRQTVTGKK
eukprot:7388787-Prymnesium_polylepis.3